MALFPTPIKTKHCHLFRHTALLLILLIILVWVEGLRSNELDNWQWESASCHRHVCFLVMALNHQVLHRLCPCPLVSDTARNLSVLASQSLILFFLFYLHWEFLLGYPTIPILVLGIFMDPFSVLPEWKNKIHQHPHMSVTKLFMMNMIPTQGYCN